MARNLITLAFVALLWLVATPSAHAMYSPTLGCFINRDPGVGLDKDGRPRINGPAAMALRTGRIVQRVASTPWGGAGPYAGMGYHDGMSLYRAYFVPGGLDPYGLQVIHTETLACGIVTVESPDKEGGLWFQFNKDSRGAGCCCKNFGWAQHGGLSDGGYRWDNGAAGGRFGGPSDPNAPKQPTGTGPGPNNPWYGGPAGPDGAAQPTDGQPVDPDTWRRQPRPQDSIWDRPEGGGPYIAQLLCVDDGSVLFEWQYSPGKTGSRRNPPKGK